MHNLSSFSSYGLCLKTCQVLTKMGLLQQFLLLAEPHKMDNILLLDVYFSVCNCCRKLLLSVGKLELINKNIIH